MVMRVLTVLFAFVAFAPMAWAQPLTDQSIEQWAGSYSELMNWAEANTVEPDVDPGPQMFRRSMQYMQSQPEYGTISSLLAGHGYGDPMAWADLSDRIFDAYQATQMAGANAALTAAQPQIMETLQALLENPNLTQAQKDEIMKSMGQVPTAVQNPVPDVDPADVAAVERNKPVIDAALGVGPIAGN